MHRAGILGSTLRTRLDSLGIAGGIEIRIDVEFILAPVRTEIECGVPVIPAPCTFLDLDLHTADGISRDIGPRSNLKGAVVIVMSHLIVSFQS